jgi:hypothetical protein
MCPNTRYQTRYRRTESYSTYNRSHPTIGPAEADIGYVVRYNRTEVLCYTCCANIRINICRAMAGSDSQLVPTGLIERW